MDCDKYISWDSKKLFDWRVWYHTRNNASFPVSLKEVFSRIMFAADDVKDGVDDNEGLVLFSSCKTLYIDYDNSSLYETNRRNFTINQMSLKYKT